VNILQLEHCAEVCRSSVRNAHLLFSRVLHQSQYNTEEVQLKLATRRSSKLPRPVQNVLLIGCYSVVLAFERNCATEEWCVAFSYASSVIPAP
jgi:hypothetical protein